MPDYFSHNICAKIILENLDSKYKKSIDKDVFLLGAQGGDVFFAYNIKPTKANLGRAMHRKNALYVFGQLINGNLSYAAGFATHYALDCTLHPEIYAFGESKKARFAHTRYESDIGLYISRKYNIRRQIVPKETLLACTSAVYDSIKHLDALVTVTGVERCLKRHFTYTKYLYRNKKTDYRFTFDFNKIDRLVDDAVSLGGEAVKCVLDKNIDPVVFSRSFLQK